MGNETVKHRNKNSFSVDFGHELPSKIKPNTNNLKLNPINQTKQKSLIISRIKNQSQENNSNDEGNILIKHETERQLKSKAKLQQDQQSKKQNNARLKKLNNLNDDLRKQLIRISSQLTEKLKKKKFEVKKTEPIDKNQNKKQSMKKQLQNAYNQIDMYKKLLTDLKLGVHSQAKVIHLEDKIKLLDDQIEKTQQQIQAVKKVTTNQSAGIRKDKSWETMQQLKSQIQALRIMIKQKTKQERLKQKQYLKQHHYMKLLQEKLKKLDDQQQQDKAKSKQSQKPTAQDIALVQQQIQHLKIKHDQYHKKLNSYMTGNKLLKQAKKQIKTKLQQTYKVIEGLKYRRDALVKLIKDNLHMFATRQQPKQEQLSQFVSQQEQQPNPIQQQQQERGTFDIEHLKDHQLRNKSKQQVNKNEHAIQMQQVHRSEPKLWRKQLTRIIQKGKKMIDQKQFSTGIKQAPKSEMKIIQINVWMNKKKQITAIQPLYLVDGRPFQANKSYKNVQDQYKVAFQLQEHDFVKSILGIFGRSGFLQYLVLQSNLGKISKIGRQQVDGDNFAIGVAKQQTPVQITGASRQDGQYWRISRLQFQVLIDTRQ